MTFELLMLATVLLLGLTAVPVLFRMVEGPTILDRAVALDMLMVDVVMGLGIYTAVTGEMWAIVPALAVTGTGFIGTLALARFVARADAPRKDDSEFEVSEVTE